ncbi:MAG: aminotransferase class IV [Bacteroidales bacterium]
MEICMGDYFIVNKQLKPVGAFKEYEQFKGFSIYEILRVEEGVPVFFEDHFQRFFGALKQRNLFIAENGEELPDQLVQLLQGNGVSKGRIKIIVNFYAYPKHFDYNLLLFFTDYHFPTDEEYDKGIQLGLFNAVRNEPNVKILDTEVRKRANDYIRKKKVYEALLVNENGYITEGSRSNVFLLKDNFVITPSDNFVLQGIARKKVIEICNENTVECEIRNIHQSELKDYDAAFITGTSLKVLPVKRIDRLEYSANHELLQFFSKKYNEKLSNYIHEKSHLFHS